MTFEGCRLRVQFRTLDPLRFPPGKAGNTLRGALGFAAETGLFRPTRSEGPSGLADPPRRFVFRAHHLDGLALAAGHRFHCELHLFYPAPGDAAEFRRIFEQLAHSGLGPHRARLILERLDFSTPMVFALAPEDASVPRVTLRFLTPTEIKSEGTIAERPDFPILIARIRDRLSTLRALYGPGPLEIDFKALADEAASVQLVSCELNQAALDRHSSRTGQTHPLGGFRGKAVYEGRLAPFLPWLRAGEFTGVGRHTVWGNGAFEVIL